MIKLLPMLTSGTRFNIDLNFEWSRNSFLMVSYHMAHQWYIPPRWVLTDRHVIFASKKQTELLQKSKTWYLDGTIKIVAKPFNQFFPISAFIKDPEGNTKQIPIALITPWSQKNAIVEHLPGQPEVERCMMDSLTLQIVFFHPHIANYSIFLNI